MKITEDTGISQAREWLWRNYQHGITMLDLCDVICVSRPWLDSFMHDRPYSGESWKQVQRVLDMAEQWPNGLPTE